eukprot:CAMPEP_0194068486 /NCGR_PEP_ID=MMETSP0009_2-20130614/87124_1 /TAXON_ID=210454 /ORGANISM="Grammatophora oceanica, Strain CCMP 410" /LENGTH=569 /DNA_ID=CAMNT_0038721591 /DNA_START=145 /DNA_END=1854 /DNA_ORIENTATION=+
MPFRIERRTTGKASLAAIDASQRRESTQQQRQEDEQQEQPPSAGVADLIESPGAFAISRRANRERRPSNDDLQWPLPEDSEGEPDQPDHEVEAPMEADVSTPSRRSRSSGHDEESERVSTLDISERSDEAQMGSNPGYVVLGTSKSPRQKWLLIAFVAALVLFGGIVIGLAVALTTRGGSSDESGNSTGYLSCADLEPLTMSEDIENFDALADELDLDTSPSITSCTPINEALLFVAQDYPRITESSRLNRFVLSILFVSNHGPNWEESHSSGWMTSISECDWTGVSCRDGEVTGIRINNNAEFTGQLPSELGMLKSLEVLEMRENDLSGTIPATFNRMSNLVQLNLENNRLTGTPLPVLAGLTWLEMLRISFNQFTGTIPNEVVFMTSLTILNTASNDFTGELPEDLGEITTLKHLEFGNNLMNGTIPESLYQLSNLEHFLLTNTDIVATLATELGSLAMLTALSISYNEFLGGEIPSEIGLLTNLRKLNFGGQPGLKGPIPKSLENLTKLTILELEDTGLNGVLPEGLCEVFRSVKIGIQSPCDVTCPDNCNCNSEKSQCDNLEIGQ